MAIKTPSTPSADPFGLRARALLQAEMRELRQTVLMLQYRLERMERREQERQRLERMKPTLGHTQYFPVVSDLLVTRKPSEQVKPTQEDTPAGVSSSRVTRPLGDIDQWTTVSELPSVKVPVVQPSRLDVQVAQAVAGHFDLYSRHANVVYLNAHNLQVLAEDYGIRDLIWGPHLMGLRCDTGLNDDQILCVTEERQDDEATQKRAAQKPVADASTILQATFNA